MRSASKIAGKHLSEARCGFYSSPQMVPEKSVVLTVALSVVLSVVLTMVLSVVPSVVTTVVLSVVLTMALTVALSVVLQMETFEEVELNQDLKEGTSATGTAPTCCSAPAFPSSSLSSPFSRPLTSLPQTVSSPPRCSLSCRGLSLSFQSPRIVRGEALFLPRKD